MEDLLVFIVELLIGLGIGATVGGGARIFLKEGGVYNPIKNLGTDILDAIDEEAYQRGNGITFEEGDITSPPPGYRKI
jgi:hypothetical protein